MNKKRAADYLDAVHAPPAPSSGKARVAKVYRAKPEPTKEELEAMLDKLSWGYQ